MGVMKNNSASTSAVGSAGTSLPLEKVFLRTASLVRRLHILCWLLFPVCTIAADILPEDPAVQNLKIVDHSDRYENYPKNFYLKNYFLVASAWLDDHRMLTSVANSETYNYHENKMSTKVILVDTRTGVVQNTGYVGEVRCYNEGRIATGDSGGWREQAHYFGKFGEPLEVFKPWYPRELELNIPSCQLVPRWKRPNSMPVTFVQRHPLKVEHGAIFVIRQNDFEGGTYQAYWEQPSGNRIDIAVNPGEEISSVEYIAEENAYLLTTSLLLNLSPTRTTKTWYPHFYRLLYLDETVKRFSVPPQLMELLKAGKATIDGRYTRRGILWHLVIRRREDRGKDVAHLQGHYLVIGKELVKMPGILKPDGCTIRGNEESVSSTKRKLLLNYYSINICKGS